MTCRLSYNTVQNIFSKFAYYLNGADKDVTLADWCYSSYILKYYRITAFICISVVTQDKNFRSCGQQ
jgi:hypothetical protein